MPVERDSSPLVSVPRKRARQTILAGPRQTCVREPWGTKQAAACPKYPRRKAHISQLATRALGRNSSGPRRIVGSRVRSRFAARGDFAVGALCRSDSPCIAQQTWLCIVGPGCPCSVRWHGGVRLSVPHSGRARRTPWFVAAAEAAGRPLVARATRCTGSHRGESLKRPTCSGCAKELFPVGVAEARRTQPNLHYHSSTESLHAPRCSS